MIAPSRLSLRRQLLLWLLLPQLVLWAGGGLLAYRFALSYVEKGIDQSLTQSVRALARQVKPVGSGLLIDFPKAAQDVLEQDPDDRISYMVSSPPGQFLLGNQRLPPPPHPPLVAGDPVFYGSVLDGHHPKQKIDFHEVTAINVDLRKSEVGFLERAGAVNGNFKLPDGTVVEGYKVALKKLRESADQGNVRLVVEGAPLKFSAERRHVASYLGKELTFRDGTRLEGVLHNHV
mgnify:CR=1 FL=1